MTDATNVPPPAGLSIRSRPVEEGKPVTNPQETASIRLRAADAVVAYLDVQRAALDARGDLGPLRMGVLCDVGECLGDDEVGSRLAHGGQPADGDVDCHRHRHPRMQRLDRGAQPTSG
jgi:hypothetical protein